MSRGTVELGEYADTFALQPCDVCTDPVSRLSGDFRPGTKLDGRKIVTLACGCEVRPMVCDLCYEPPVPGAKPLSRCQAHGPAQDMVEFMMTRCREGRREKGDMPGRMGWKL